MIAVVDYGAGNLSSVRKALRYLGRESAVTGDPAALERADGVVLPGVGAFRDGMDGLRAAGLTEVLPELISGGKPFLGICLGMQLLFEEGTEPERCRGLGVFPGVVEVMRSETLKIPHMGWNRITGTDEILFGDAGERYVYFVHSFLRTSDALPELAAVCEYTKPFAAAVRRGNCLATQFHPEKSGDDGMAMLKKFLEVTGC